MRLGNESISLLTICNDFSGESVSFPSDRTTCLCQITNIKQNNNFHFHSHWQKKSLRLCCNPSVTPDLAPFRGGNPENILFHLYQVGPDLLIQGHQWLIQQNCYIDLSTGSMSGNVPPLFFLAKVQGNLSDMTPPPGSTLCYMQGL